MLLTYSSCLECKRRKVEDCTKGGTTLDERDKNSVEIEKKEKLLKVDRKRVSMQQNYAMKYSMSCKYA